MLRNIINKSDIHDINIEIAAYQRMINFYENYDAKPENQDYVANRLKFLYGIQSEYLIARDISQENAKKSL
jgi:hypothetical protein